MAVDPKLVGGGAAVVAIGGGSGYAISQATSSKTDESSGKTGQEAPEVPIYTSGSFGEGKLGKALKDAKFVLLSPTKAEETKGNALVEAHKGEDTTFNAKKLQTNCKTSLETSFTDSTTVSEDFKNAVKKCTEIISFEARAGQLEIVIEKQDGTNGSTMMSKLTVDIATKSVVANLKPTTGTASEADIKKFCLDVGKLTGQSFTTTTTEKNNLETQGKNYLTVCSKEDTKKTTDFGTGKVPTPSAGG